MRNSVIGVRLVPSRPIRDAAVQAVAEGLIEHGPPFIGALLRGFANATLVVIGCGLGMLSHAALGLTVIPSSGVALTTTATMLGVEYRRRPRGSSFSPDDPA